MTATGDCVGIGSGALAPGHPYLQQVPPQGFPHLKVEQAQNSRLSQPQQATDLPRTHRQRAPTLINNV
jgi:hypothetical protein